MKKEGNDTQALQSFKDATVRAPGIAEAHYNTGIQYEKRGRLAKSGREYAKAVALDAHFRTLSFTWPMCWRSKARS